MQWYQKRFRRNLVDMHIEDWNDEFLSKFDPEEYVEHLKIGHINAPMLYLQSHVGLCYWPTKSGKMHNALIGCEDKMKRVERLCHANGMDVIAYYSLIYNNWAHEHHPEWRIVDMKGRNTLEQTAVATANVAQTTWNTALSRKSKSKNYASTLTSKAYSSTCCSGRRFAPAPAAAPDGKRRSAARCRRR